MSWCFQLRGRRVHRYVFAFSPNDTWSDMYVYIHIAIVWCVRVCTHSYCATTEKIICTQSHLSLFLSLSCDKHVREQLLQQATDGATQNISPLATEIPPPPSPLNTLRCSVWQVNRRGKFSFVVFKTFVIRAREVFFLSSLSLSHTNTHTHTHSYTYNHIRWGRFSSVVFKTSFVTKS